MNMHLNCRLLSVSLEEEYMAYARNDTHFGMDTQKCRVRYQSAEWRD